MEYRNIIGKSKTNAITYILNAKTKAAGQQAQTEAVITQTAHRYSLFCEEEVGIWHNP